jgi:hypothetical protein
MWRDKRWRVLDENIFHMHFCNASEATYFQQALKWRVSEEPLFHESVCGAAARLTEEPSFARSCSRFEIQLEEKKVTPLVSLHQILKKKSDNHKFPGISPGA